MDEKYIQDLYNGLGGSEVFGSYDKYKELISTDSSYAKDIHNNFGEETLGSFENFSKLVMGKTEAVQDAAPVTAEVKEADTESMLEDGLLDSQSQGSLSLDNELPPEYLINEKEVKRTYLNDKLNDSEFIEGLKDGKINVSVKNDPKIMDLLERKMESQEKDTFLERTFGKIPITDFFGDLYRAGVQGVLQAETVDPSLDLMTAGADASEEEVYQYIQKNKEIAEKSMESDEMKDFNRVYDENGGGAFGFLMGVIESPTVLPSLFVSSMATQVASLQSDEVATAAVVGAGAGTVIPGIGTAIGGFAAAATTMEAGLTFSELLEEQIEGELTPEKIRTVLNDPEKLSDLRMKAIGRGVAIGAVELLTAGLAKGVTGAGARAVSKGKSIAGRAARKATAPLAGGAVEVVGGMTGEVAGRLAADQEMDIKDIGFEGFAGLGSAPISVLPTAIKNINIVSGRANAAKVAKKGGYDNVSSVFDPKTDIDETTIKLSVNKNTSNIVDEQVEIEVANGRMTQEESESIKENFRATQGAVNTANKVDRLSKENKPEAIKLLIEEEKLKNKIKDVDNSALTKTESERLKQVQSRLEEISNPKEESTSTEIEVTDSEYKDFVDNGNVTDERLSSLAQKVKDNTELTEKEQAMFNDKTSEVEEILKTFTEPVVEEASEVPVEVTKLRAEEQAEMLEQVPGAENALTDGKVDREKIATEEGKVKFDEIYDKYNDKISPLLETTPLEIKEEIKLSDSELSTESVYNKNVEEDNEDFIKGSNEFKDKAVNYDEGINDPKFIEENTVKEEVDVNDIIPTQNKLFKKSLNNKSTESPILIKVGNKYYVEDGHHRIADKIMSGGGKLNATVYNLTPLETATSEKEVPEKFNNATILVSKGEPINEVELEDSINEAYDYLSEIENDKSEDAEIMRSLVEDEIEKLENYDNITETQTRKIAEEKTVRTVKKTPRKTSPKREKDFVGKKATYSDNKGAGGRGSIIIQEGPDGRDYYVIEQANDAKVILGRRDKAFSDGVVNFDENNNPTSVTFPMSEGKQVTVKDPAIAQEFELEQMKQPEYDEQIFEETYIEFVGEEKVEVPKPKETTKAAPKTKAAPTKKITAKERVLGKFGKGRVKNKVRKQVENARKALSKIAKGVTIEVYNTQEEFEAAGGKPISRGEYVLRTKTIRINLEKANTRTVAHEVFHAILLKDGISNAKAQQITSNMINAVRKVASKKLLKELDDFSKNYKTELQSEESMAQLFGILAENYESSPQSVKDLINDWLRKLAKVLNVPVEGILARDKQVLEFLDVVSGKVAGGEVIEKTDVALLQEQEQGSKGLPETRQQKVFRAGNLVDKAETIYKFEGQRSTGHFGTGFYFFGKREDAQEYAKRTGTDTASRIVSEVNLDDYNLAPASLALHKDLKDINDEYSSFKFLKRNLNSKVSSYEIGIVARTLGIDLPSDLSSKYAEDITKKLRSSSNKESASTLVMKKLGFDGVDATGTELDNAIYGTVVYDIKPQTRKQKAQDDFTIQDVIENAEQEGLTRKETIEVLQELGFTKEEIRKAIKPSPSVSKVLGKPKEKKVSMSEKQALNKQIRDFARGVREAYKDQENFKKKVNKLISDNFKLFGNLTPSKVIALTRRALEVSSSKPKSLDKFIDYAAKLEQMTEDNVRKDILKRVIRNITPKKLKKTVGGVLKGKIANYEGKVLSSIRNAIKEDSVESLQNSIDELENKQAQGIKLSEKEIFLLQVAKISNNLLSGDLKKTLEAEAKIEALIKDGKSKYREDIQKRATEYERLVIESLPAITGGKKLTDQFGKLEQGAKRRPLTEGIREKLSGFLDYGEGLRTLLDKIDRTAQRDESGYGGVIDKELYEPIADGRREKDSLDTSKINELSDKLTKLYGKKKKKALRDNQKPKNLGTFTDRKGNEVKLFLSQNQAYPLYQYMQDPSNMATFEAMGFTDEMLQAVEDFLTPEIKEWADWQMSEFFPKYYDQINAVYKDMNDIDLPKQKIYVPVIRNLEGLNEKEVGVDEITFGNPQSTYKSLKQRQSSKAPFDMTKDGNEKLMEYTEGMNRYIAFAKPVKRLNVVFKNKDVRNAIREFNSTETLKVIDGFIEGIANNSSDMGQRIALLDKIRGNVTIASLALAPTVTIKQLTSIPAYASDIPISKFISGLGAFAKNPKKVHDILMESEYMQRRYKDGFERDLEGMKGDYDNMLKGTSNLKNKMMFLIKWGDKGAILMGGYSVYKYHFDKSRAEGKSIGESKKIALSKFEEATKLSQQSTNIEDLSGFQRMGSIGKLFTMYMTSPIAYFRQERKSARDFVKGYKFGDKKLMRNAVKRFTIYHFVLPLVFQYVASGLPGLLTDWDEEDEKDLMRAASIGSLNGVFIAGQLISYFGDILTDKAWVRGGKFSPSPAFDAIVNIMNQSEDVISEWNKNPDKFSDDLMKEMIDLGFSVDVAVGLPVNRVKKLIENWKTIADDNDLETREKIALGLGFSPYVVTPKKKSKKDNTSESERRSRRDTRRSSRRRN
jgi:hypothetical protein